MLNLKTGKHFTDTPTMTRGGFLKGILASGIAPSITLATIANAGSANASVGRGMMRGVGGRMAAAFGGSEEKTPYIEWVGTTGVTTFNLLPAFQNIDGDAIEVTFKCATDFKFNGSLLGESSSGTAMSVFIYSSELTANQLHYIYTQGFDIFAKHTLKIQYSPMSVIMDGVERAATVFSNKMQSIAIGNYGRNEGGNGFKGKIYGFKKWNAGVLTYDCIPAINPSNNEATFYNRSTNVYLTKHQSTKPLAYGEE